MVGVLTVVLGTLRCIAAKLQPSSQSQVRSAAAAAAAAATPAKAAAATATVTAPDAGSGVGVKPIAHAWAAIAMRSVGYLVGLAAIAPAIVNLTTTVSDAKMDRLAALGILGHFTFHDYGVSNGR